MKPAIAQSQKLFGRARTQIKKDRTIVTEADLALSRLWGQTLADLKNDPRHVLIDEETVGSQSDLWERINTSHYQWVLDPIDGTSSYAAGRPMWGICAAVMKDRKPYIGLTYLACDNALILATPKHVTFQPLGGRVRKLTCPPPLAEPALALDSGIFKFLDIKNLPYKFNNLGASCTLIGWTALGRYTAASSLGALWDIASLWPAMQSLGFGHFRLKDGARVDKVSPEFFDSKLKIKDFCVFSSKADCDRIQKFILKP